MTDFKIGCKVKCIDSNGYQFIETGKIYTVMDLSIDIDKVLTLYLKNIGFFYESNLFIRVNTLKDKLTLAKELIK
jgi:hypothetical protein